jgi:hypothetical protein
LAVNGWAGPGRRGDETEDARHLLAEKFEKRQVLFDIVVVVRKTGGEACFVVTDEQGAILGDPVTPGLFAVGKVANDLQNAPTPRDRSGPKLLRRESGDCAAQVMWAFQVISDQALGVHLSPLHLHLREPGSDSPPPFIIQFLENRQHRRATARSSG